MKSISAILTLILTILLTTTSCNTINRLTGRRTTVSSAQVDSKEHSRNISGRIPRGKRTNKNDHSQAPVINHVASNSSNTSFNTADSISLIKNLDGKWLFESVNGISINNVDERPSLTFDENSRLFYANNACNYFNGTYSVGPQGSIALTPTVATGALCDGENWSSYIESMWNSINKMEISQRHGQDYLDLKNNKVTIATLRRYCSSILNGMWDVGEINGRVINGNYNLTIVIDLIENRIHGNSGCNIFTGNIYQDPNTDFSVQFQDMRVERRQGVDTGDETALLTSLEQVETAIPGSDSDNIILTDSKGRHLIKLCRH